MLADSIAENNNNIEETCSFLCYLPKSPTVSFILFANQICGVGSFFYLTVNVGPQPNMSSSGTEPALFATPDVLHAAGRNGWDSLAPFSGLYGIFQLPTSQKRPPSSQVKTPQEPDMSHRGLTNEFWMSLLNCTKKTCSSILSWSKL